MAGNHPKRGKTGNEGRQSGSGCAFGPYQGLETTRNGGLTGDKMPFKSRIRLPAPTYGHFSVLDAVRTRQGNPDSHRQTLCYCLCLIGQKASTVYTKTRVRLVVGPLASVASACNGPNQHGCNPESRMSDPSANMAVRSRHWRVRCSSSKGGST